MYKIDNWKECNKITLLNVLNPEACTIDTMPAGAIPFPFGDCRICSDKATGVHYGVATCEGCKVSGEVLFTCLALVRVFAKLEFFKNPNKNSKWVGPGPIRIIFF